MDLCPASATDSQLYIHAAAGNGAGYHIFLPQGAEIAGGKQLGEGNILQLQGGTGKEIQIPQTDPLKIGRFVGPDKGGKGLVQLLGKVFPAIVAGAAQGNEPAGQVYPPDAIPGGKLVVYRGRGVFQGQMTGRAGDFRRGVFFFPEKLGIVIPDCFLKSYRRIGADCQDLRKPELADHLTQRIPPVMAAGFMGKHYHRSSKCVVSIIA